MNHNFSIEQFIDISNYATDLLLHIETVLIWTTFVNFWNTQFVELYCYS